MACIGLHAWLRIYPRYAKVLNTALAFAVFLPKFALVGHVAVGNRILGLAKQKEWGTSLFAKIASQPWMTALSVARETNFEIGFMVFLISLLAAQYILAFVRVCTKKLRLHYVPRNKIAELKPYATLIESIRAASFPHASVFSGRNRCYTFQFRIGKRFEGLPTASEQEIKILSRVAETRTVRLA